MLLKLLFLTVLILHSTNAEIGIRSKRCGGFNGYGTGMGYGYGYSGYSSMQSVMSPPPYYTFPIPNSPPMMATPCGGVAYLQTPPLMTMGSCGFCSTMYYG